MWKSICANGKTDEEKSSVLYLIYSTWTPYVTKHDCRILNDIQVEGSALEVE